MSVALHRDGHGLRRDGIRAATEQAPLAQGPDGREEQRDEEHADQRRHEHPEEDAGPDRVTTRRTGPARRQQRRDTQDKRERGHEDRPQPLAARSEEHTSELQSRLHLVCRLLLEKIKQYSRYFSP